MKQILFISYSLEDMKTVKQFALQLSLRGFDLWMDEKNISFGGNYTTAILHGIHEADVYLVFLSENSIKSRWVNAEIDIALREKNSLLFLFAWMILKFQWRYPILIMLMHAFP